MQEGNLESLLEEAKNLEKKFEWLQAIKLYQKAADLVFKKKDLSKAAELQEQMGFCFGRAAFQAQTNTEFKKLVKQAIKTYRKEIKILEKTRHENRQRKVDHANALAVFSQSQYEASPRKKRELLDNWWILEHKLLESYETIGDLHSLGKTYNDIAEFWTFDMIWLQGAVMQKGREPDTVRGYVEKAIQILSRLNDDYELARAYNIATWLYGWGEWDIESTNEIILFNKKCKDYLKIALERSKNTGDAWLINGSYYAASIAASHCHMDLKLVLDYSKKALEYAKITKDKRKLAFAYRYLSETTNFMAFYLEDPDKQKAMYNEAIKMAQQAIKQTKITNLKLGMSVATATEAYSLVGLATIESNLRTKRSLIEKSVQKIQEAIEYSKGYDRVAGSYLLGLSNNLRMLASIQTDIKERRKLLQEALQQSKNYITYLEEFVPSHLLAISNGHYYLALVYYGLSQIAVPQSAKIELLTDAVIALDKCLKLIAEKRAYIKNGWAVGQYFGQYYSKLGEVLQEIYYMTRKEKKLNKAIEAYKQAASDFEKAEMPSHVAESYWNIAQLYDKVGKNQEASQNYEKAAEAYHLASKKIPQLEQFYKDHSSYMRAWSKIEQARYSHSIEKYEEAQQHYEMAAKLHDLTSSWNYLTPNYFAWSYMEEAESLSRNEKTELAKQTFQKALQQFNRAEESIKEKLEKISSEEEIEMIQSLLKASDLRRKYCQARILMEEAKLLDREGKYLQSSRNYGEAAQNMSEIVDKMDVEAERKELEYVAILCRAWEKMAVAQETSSSELYLEAAELFEQAKDYCNIRKASLWALGNINFSRGLAAGIAYQMNLDLDEHSRAKSFIKTAATYYSQAGFSNASEYARATQRLFDAYLYINKAESESDQEIRAKQYQMVENLLQIAAGSFMKAKQPEKQAQVQEILVNVREEKTLAISLGQVMKAPSIASSTLSFSTPTPTSEVSVGLEQFAHANVQANLIIHVKEVKVGEAFCLSIEFVNAGREPALLMRVEEFIPRDFIIVKKPEIYRIEDTNLNMKGKQLAPLKLVEVKLTLQPSKKGQYQLNPKVHYLDELGQNKSLQLKTLEIKVEEVVLEDRVSTGTQELDSLLLGGIPEEYAVVLTGPPSDEREYLIKNFLDAGIKEAEVVFHVFTEADGLETLLKNPSFILFLCNPKPKTQVPDLPNIYKLRSKTDLTNLSISLAKAYRNIDQSKKKRICVEIISDVLISYKAEATRRWISELITDLGSKGFTMLAVMDPKEHPPDQATTVINLFDGEIELTQTEDPLECRKSIRVKKLRNQDYIKNSICLTNK